MIRRYVIAAASAALVACHMIIGVTDLEGPASGRDAGDDDDFDWDFDAAVSPPDTGPPPPPPPPMDAGEDAPNRRRVFVTSRVFTGNFGGVEKGNTVCQEAATAAGLGGQWGVWLSADGTKALDTLTFDGPYELVTGTQIAPDKASLLGGLATAINVNEDGELAAAPTLVWTGTKADGATSDTCQNWSSKNAIYSGTAGSFDQKDARWNNNGGQTSPIRWPTGWSCDRGAHLYCFER